LTKIESRPIKASPFEYFFYVDVISAPGKLAVVNEAVAELRRVSAWLKVLGTYTT
jgi:prephenate dehydratase/chorismate mutase/prephenate dehydratase